MVRGDIVYADSHGDEFAGAAQALQRAEAIRNELLGDTEWGGYVIEVHDASENLISLIPLSELTDAPTEPPGSYVLSPRERNILRELSKGSTVAEIARDYSLSVRAVDIFRARMFDRIEIGTLSTNIAESRRGARDGN